MVTGILGKGEHPKTYESYEYFKLKLFGDDFMSTPNAKIGTYILTIGFP